MSDCALADDLEQGEALFNDVLGYANDVGLFAEEIDPVGGGAWGNFPQAFTHVGLIDAALLLEEARQRRASDRSTGQGSW